MQKALSAPAAAVSSKADSAQAAAARQKLLRHRQYALPKVAPAEVATVEPKFASRLTAVAAPTASPSPATAVASTAAAAPAAAAALVTTAAPAACCVCSFCCDRTGCFEGDVAYLAANVAALVDLA
ncbi:hypothetical protein FGB62_50g014 [Gracilaria domingensis]|nr:hypothetical protein FGB62_50g014 [Gracilaria domingensis]